MSGKDATSITPVGHPRGGTTIDRLAKAPGGELNITKELIDTSIQRKSGNCMIAESVKARFPWAQRVDVDIQTIRFSDPEKGERYTFLTPRSGQIALVMFDQGLPVEPFKLRLRGGAVTRMGQGGKNSKRAGKTKIVQPPESHGEKPVRVGGRTPPRGALHHPTAAGAERKFGLRSLDRIPELRKE